MVEVCNSFVQQLPWNELRHRPMEKTVYAQDFSTSYSRGKATRPHSFAQDCAVICAALISETSHLFVDSARLTAIESKGMLRKTTFVILAVFAILLLQFADCVSAVAHDQESMQCCGSMPCDQSNQSHDCCKGMLSSQSSSVLPTAHATLVPPTTGAAEYLPLPQVVFISDAPSANCAVTQHSPPKLYTLYSSFLI